MKTKRQILVEIHDELLSHAYDATIEEYVGKLDYEDFPKEYREYLKRYVENPEYSTGMLYIDYLMENDYIR